MEANKEDYVEILNKLKSIVGNLREIGTPEALKAIQPRTLELIKELEEKINGTQQ
jgi:hypothetical protein